MSFTGRFQQVASEYEQIKSAGIDPQVAELAEYHGLGWDAAGHLTLLELSTRLTACFFPFR